MKSNDVSQAGKVGRIYLRYEFGVGFLNLGEGHDSSVDNLSRCNAPVSEDRCRTGTITHAVIFVGLGLEMTRFNDNMQTNNVQQVDGRVTTLLYTPVSDDSARWVIR